MNWRVGWVKTAEDELADIWLRALIAAPLQQPQA